jgi:hypothetical protein
MGGTDPKDCEEKFVFGSDGKPFFVSGPNETHEKCQRIISILTRKCGADGFHYLTPASDYDMLAMDENFPDENMVFEQRKVVE